MIAAQANDGFSKLLAGRPHRGDRAAGDPDHRRRHPPHPAHRRDPAVHELRRIERRDELRAGRAAADHQPPHRAGAARRAGATRGRGDAEREACVNRSIRRLYLAICGGLRPARGLMLGWWQVVAADEPEGPPATTSQTPRRSGCIDRGRILTRRRQVLATSQAARSYGARRSSSGVYPQGELAAHVVGYAIADRAAPGIESRRTTATCGQLRRGAAAAAAQPEARSRAPTCSSASTRAIQQVAADALGGRVGAVVALDPRTGAGARDGIVRRRSTCRRGLTDFAAIRRQPGAPLLSPRRRRAASRRARPSRW